MTNFPIPKILQCNHFTTNVSSHDTRYVRDYEFDFYLDGERDIYIDDRHYKISKSCMVFRKPGQLAQGIGNYNMYMLTLDFSLKYEKSTSNYLRSSDTPQQEPCNLDVLNDIPDVFYPYHQDDIITLYKEMFKCSYPNIINEQLQKKIVLEFLFLVLSDAYKYNCEFLQNKLSKKTYVEQACNYITKNYSKPLSLDVIANHLALNKNYLIKLFKKELAMTPNEYIMKTRLFYAKLMLMQTSLAVKNIGSSCGFNNASYFIKCFREAFGTSPLLYRNNHKNVTKDSNI